MEDSKVSGKHRKPDLWMPWYVGDYLTDTTHLSRAEHGSYLLMLAHAWMHKGVLPPDDERLARIAHATREEWQQCKNVILEFWMLNESGYTQKRLIEEMAKAQKMVDQRSSAGKASAAKRWGNERYNDSITSVTIPYERDDAPSPSPLPSNQPKSKTLAPSGASEFDSLFWPAYPRKEAKAEALKAWKKVANGNIQAILDALKPSRWPEHWKDRQFIPYPATWLNGKRWLDEQPPQPKKHFVI